MLAQTCRGERPKTICLKGAAATVCAFLVAAILLLIPSPGDCAPSVPDLLAQKLGQDNPAALAAIAIFATTYLVIAIGKFPGYQLDRAGAALLGAALMAGLGVMPLNEAYRAIDFDTITLLLGMMIVVANLRLAGFFGLAAAWIGRRAHRPILLLIGMTAVSALFSAFLVNDAVCLM